MSPRPLTLMFLSPSQRGRFLNLTGGQQWPVTKLAPHLLWHTHTPPLFAHFHGVNTVLASVPSPLGFNPRPTEFLSVEHTLLEGVEGAPSMWGLQTLRKRLILVQLLPCCSRPTVPVFVPCVPAAGAEALSP